MATITNILLYFVLNWKDEIVRMDLYGCFSIFPMFRQTEGMLGAYVCARSSDKTLSHKHYEDFANLTHEQHEHQFQSNRNSGNGSGDSISSSSKTAMQTAFSRFDLDFFLNIIYEKYSLKAGFILCYAFVHLFRYACNHPVKSSRRSTLDCLD